MPKPKGKPGKKPGSGGALDAQQRALREEEERLQAEIQALQQRIIEAPRLAAEAERQRREAQFADSPRQYIHGANLLDARQAQEAGPRRAVPTGKRRKPAVLRAQRTTDRTKTFVLLVVVAFMLCWALSLYFNLFN